MTKKKHRGKQMIRRPRQWWRLQKSFS